jgi:hypothetical protein
VHTNKKIEWFVNMYISYDASLLPNLLQNAQKHQHTHITCKMKNHVVCRSLAIASMHEQKI